MDFDAFKAVVLDLVAEENYDRFDEIFVGKAINLGCIDFLDKTEVVDTHWTRVTVANQLWYKTPLGNYEIKRVEWYDVSEDYKYTMLRKTMNEMDEEYQYHIDYTEEDWQQTTGSPQIWIPREHDVIGIWPACDTQGDTLYLYGRERHTDMSASDSKSEIPTEYQIIPCYFAAAMLLRSDNDDRTAKYERKYKEEVMMAKRTVADRKKKMPGKWRIYTY